VRQTPFEHAASVHASGGSQSSTLQHSAQNGEVLVALQHCSPAPQSDSQVPLVAHDSQGPQVNSQLPASQTSQGSQSSSVQQSAHAPFSQQTWPGQSGRLGQQREALIQMPSQHFSSSVLQQVLSSLVPQGNSNVSQQTPTIWLHRLLGQHPASPQQFSVAEMQHSMSLQRNSSGSSQSGTCAEALGTFAAAAPPRTAPPKSPLRMLRRETPLARERVKASNRRSSIVALLVPCAIANDAVPTSSD
jgi:hypothetical protein